MIYPIVAFGDPVLKTPAKAVPADFPADELQQLVADMFATMYSAHGVGLAAPQIAKSLRLFVIDSGPMVDDEHEETGEKIELAQTEAAVKRAFINPEMVEETSKEVGFEEG